MMKTILAVVTGAILGAGCTTATAVRTRRIHLRAGKYTVKALAAVGYGEWLSVPVVVEAGKTTEVHLNGQWKAPDSTWGEDLVFSPSGLPMGWRANP